MKTHYFTLDQANAVIPEIEPLVAELLERKAKIVDSKDELEILFQPGTSDVGGPAASQIVLEFIAIEKLVEKISSYGCILKDLNSGLVDFLSERNGRDVYLCWRFGEPQVEYYHELHTGFNGRHRV